MYAVPVPPVWGGVFSMKDLDDAADTRNRDLASDVPCGPISIQSLSHARQREAMTTRGGTKLV